MIRSNLSLSLRRRLCQRFKSTDAPGSSKNQRKKKGSGYDEQYNDIMNKFFQKNNTAKKLSSPPAPPPRKIENRKLDLSKYRVPKSTPSPAIDTNDRTKTEATVRQKLQDRPPSREADDEPLSNLIRKMQLTYAQIEQKEKSQTQGEQPTPKWRIPTSNERNTKPERITLKPLQHTPSKPTDTESSPLIQLPSHSISLTEASLLFRQKASDIRKILDSLVEDNEQKDDDIRIDTDTQELIALELNVDFKRSNRRQIQDDQEVLLNRRGIEDQNLAPRPPVVCIMGHVDHGKTTLMDSLRRRAAGVQKEKKTKNKKAPTKAKKGGDVAGTEAGGITQVISAFQVPLSGHEFGAVTFLDTPGHAAFKSMRQSGSDAADIIVLVVAADDGVSPQTVEIINFYKSIASGSNGGISMIVAMNKIDKPGIDATEARHRIESQLLEHGILVEGMPTSDPSAYGAPVQLVPVSGLTEEGLDELVEALALQSEVMDLRADDRARAEGVVMDARVDKGLGVVADCIVRWGALEKGSVVVSGTSYGKVRLLKDMGDKQLKKGTPSQPVRLVGFDAVPKAGDPFVCVSSEEKAVELVERRKAARELAKETKSAQDTDAELQSAGKGLMNQRWRENLERKYGLDADVDEQIRIPIIVKANADGSLAAIRECLVAIAEESKLNIIIDPIKEGVGSATKAEVQMAKDCNASIFCFNVKNEQMVSAFANELNVPICQNDVIYRLLEEAKEEFARFLPSREVEKVHGKGKVQAVFEIGGSSAKVAGLQVTDGVLYRDKVDRKVSAVFRVVRDGQVVTEGPLAATSLKHFKDDVDEIGRGKECGLSLSGFNDFMEGDVVECFSKELKQEFV